MPFGYRTGANPSRTTLSSGDRPPLVPYAEEQAILKEMISLREEELDPSPRR